jgi:cold shock CspA family protein
MDVIGYVCRLVREKGFCFVKYDGRDYFLHKQEFDGFWDDLVTDYEGKRKIEIEFEQSEGPKGLRATNARRIDRGV